MDLSHLWSFVQGLTPAAPVSPADVQIALTPYTDKLVHILKFKVGRGDRRGGARVGGSTGAQRRQMRPDVIWAPAAA